jgi:hypothetical protein
MAKKTTRSKPELQPAAPDAAAPAAKPRARAKSKSTPADETASVSMASEPSDDDIRLRAYHRYLERGGGHGMDFEDWLQARQDLIAKK